MDGTVLASILVGVLAAWALLLAILWVLRPRHASLKELLAVVPDVLRLIRDLLADRSVPAGLRLALLGLLVWLISPIDLIPEFIPVLGPLDDVIVAVIVLRYVRRRLGEDELRRRWRGSDESFELLRRVIGPETRRSPG
jgi:uncharacterized membrane protein YkvA (DUF1232 family)